MSTLEVAMKQMLDAGMTVPDIMSQVTHMIGVLKRDTLTEERLEKKEYTYVTCYVKDSTRETEFRYERFLVSTPFKGPAKILAEKYAARKGWIIHPYSVNLNRKGKRFVMYPRNYIVQARKLYAENKFI